MKSNPELVSFFFEMFLLKMYFFRNILEEEFICETEGKFPLKDCTGFWNCEKEGTTFNSQLLFCPPQLKFDVSDEKCMPSDTVNQFLSNLLFMSLINFDTNR